MGKHPKPEELRSFLQGSLIPETGALNHIFRCLRCRGALRKEWTLLSRRPLPGEIYDEPYYRAFERTLQIHGTREKERLAADSRRREAGFEGVEDLVRNLSAQECLQPGQGFAAIEALLRECRNLRHGQPRKIIHTAVLAWKTAQCLDPRQNGTAVVADLKARILAELGNAYRVADDFPTASVVLQKAMSWVDRGSGDFLLIAYISDLVASLHADQRRFEEAVEILDRVARTYLKLGDRHLAGRALIKKGIFTGFDQRPKEAVELLLQGEDLLEEDREPVLQLTALHNRAWFLVDCGRHHEARRLVWQNSDSYQRFAEPWLLVRKRWLDGRIDGAIGKYDRAEEHLEAVQRELLQLDQIYDAALAALDLLRLRLLQGWTHEIPDRVDDVIGIFRRHHLSRGALGCLKIFRDRCLDSQLSLQDLCQMLALVASAVEEQGGSRLRRGQGF